MDLASRSAKMAEIQAFQAHEVMLLQSRQYHEWLKLFTADLHYWMPVYSVNESGDSSAPNELAHFDDNLETLTLRVRRAMSASAWTERPPSRIRYFIVPLSFDEDASMNTVEVHSNMMIYQTRLQREENMFVGTRKDILRRVDGNFRIAARTATIDRTVLGSKNITVFF